MNKNHIFALWGGLYAVCAALGFINTQSTAAQVLMTLLAIIFFAPAALLLQLSRTGGDLSIAVLIRNFSLASLILTTVLLIANFLSVLAPELLGNILYGILVIVSAPMICCGNWALSMFLWACLMVCSIKILKTKKNS